MGNLLCCQNNKENEEDLDNNIIIKKKELQNVMENLNNNKIHLFFYNIFVFEYMLMILHI